MFFTNRRKKCPGSQTKQSRQNSIKKSIPFYIMFIPVFIYFEVFRYVPLLLSLVISVEKYQPAKHPYYFAGLYYIQEPSAMTPANVLPVEDGDVVFDMCAAPGGKSTELGAKLDRTGLLITNDISNSRAKALLKNVEVFGIPNLCVLSEVPK